MTAKRNQSKHLDKSVIFAFLAVFVVALTTWAFKYANNVPCEDINFAMEAKEYRVGELIKFVDNTSGAETWEWDFGDDSEKATRKQPLHIFEKEGEYQVNLLVNNVCERTETLVIKEKEEILDPSKFPVFELPESIMVGKTLEVKDMTENASTWEWRFGETASVNSKEKNAEYVFEESGLKTVSLIVNGDLKYITKKKINVLPRPGEKVVITEISQPKRDAGWNIKMAPKEEKNKIKDKPGGDGASGPMAPKAAPFINNNAFAVKLTQVADEKTRPQAFTEYFCGDINKGIVVNGKNTTFLVFCEKIKGKKVKKVKVNLIRDKGSNCIKTATIDYKKGGLF